MDTDTPAAREGTITRKCSHCQHDCSHCQQSLSTRQVPETRYAISYATAAERYSVSTRTMKRLAKDHPELTVCFGRRRLFLVAKLQSYLETQH
jgi:hypothetical protein